MEKRLYRSRSERMIWGVCGGLAHYFDIDPVIVRIIFVLLLFANGIGLLAYIIMAIVVPLEGSKSTEPKDTVRENLEEMKQTAGEVGQEIRATFTTEEKAETAETVKNRRNMIGILLVVIGAIFLTSNLVGNLNFFWWFRWGYLWPIILIAVGLIIVFGMRRRR